MRKKLFFTMVTLFLITGCTNIQQRPNIASCNELLATSSDCSKSSFIKLKSENNTEYPSVAFIEFSNEGSPFDQSNIDAVFSKIDDLRQQSSKSLLMVVFIHGWHHNAQQDDKNVIEFKDFLRALQKEEQSLNVGNPRTVLGIYMGWQGKSTEIDIVNFLSYSKKKELALKTGKKSVTGILKRLSSIRTSDPKSRLILVGHSFGGGVLYSAIKDELIEKIQNSKGGEAKVFGDLVILMNPAVEAERFEYIHEVMGKTFPKCTPLAMASFTSEADTALSDEFPKGMKIFYRKKMKGDSSDDLKKTPYGLYEEFRNYELRIDDNVEINTNLTKNAFKEAVPTWTSFRRAMSSYNIGGISLTYKANTPAWQPVLNIRVDESLIGDHNKIWDPKFMYFVRGLIGMEFAKSRLCR